LTLSESIRSSSELRHPREARGASEDPPHRGSLGV
jgi:hypothetical protein